MCRLGIALGGPFFLAHRPDDDCRIASLAVELDNFVIAFRLHCHAADWTGLRRLRGRFHRS